MTIIKKTTKRQHTSGLDPYEMMTREIECMIQDLKDLLPGDQPLHERNEKLFNLVKARMINRYTEELEFFAFKGHQTDIEHSLEMIMSINEMRL